MLVDFQEVYVNFRQLKAVFFFFFFTPSVSLVHQRKWWNVDTFWYSQLRTKTDLLRVWGKTAIRSVRYFAPINLTCEKLVLPLTYMSACDTITILCKCKYKNILCQCKQIWYSHTTAFKKEWIVYLLPVLWSKGVGPFFVEILKDFYPITIFFVALEPTNNEWTKRSHLYPFTAGKQTPP